MTTVERTTDGYAELREAHEHEIASLRRRARLAITISAVLALALVGLGIWVLIDRSESSETATTDAVQQVLDDYIDAWNDYDTDAFDRLTTDDYIHQNPTETNDKATQLNGIGQLGRFGWHVDVVGDAMMVGDGPWYVASANHLTYSGTESDGISVVTIRDDDGTLKVSRHVYLGDV